MMRSWLTGFDPETVWQPESRSEPAKLAAASPSITGRDIRADLSGVSILLV
jgi:hypothetical protein